MTRSEVSPLRCAGVGEGPEHHQAVPRSASGFSNQNRTSEIILDFDSAFGVLSGSSLQFRRHQIGLSDMLCNVSACLKLFEKHLCVLMLRSYKEQWCYGLELPLIFYRRMILSLVT
ncbi:uncharacterized protein [Triticum aestivum]|uniref:uncharacterized protein isoform X1 n=1 Tax=Triticum aestivum TaxID=4565 RepID=UPI001D003033|nr:uncharacterized protein LOC123088179 isoform X1 [Triticum aestivum]XP_044366302.1 uncharacterized protein LOC123088179 isoform X1 [Triticum aestivum]XP_044366303.1 uncharacterized protein LOC123088179 isoform X1 [Triticum aestivum]XP_044366304.1 uncharacterized protein LOC123088179 isoform X1 [Triticum aestivum]XP_044366305.1 uncharacterized protein LOC123088179 isoform X1 [Triticum aestivum]XP_044366306.1 uncharacterized protein LOC123088179 isoform X1 [Triticum aestivum]XP_044366307.1 un